MSIFSAVGDMLGIGESAGDKAIAAQTAAAARAAEVQKQMYDQSREDLAPWREAGTTALSGMQDPSFQKNFTMADFQADPGYAFRLQQGQQALERSAAARGGLMGGGTMKALTDYGQNMGAQEYQAAYDRFNNDANTRYSRLSNLAGMGANAASQQAGFAQNYGNNMASNAIGLGNAQGAAYVGDANRSSNNLNQAMMMGALAFCDARLKTEIEPVSRADLAELKACVKAYKFKYKNEKHGKGDFIGPMAQDLQKCKLGKDLVIEDAEGNLQIDVNRTLMLVLASMGDA